MTMLRIPMRATTLLQRATASAAATLVHHPTSTSVAVRARPLTTYSGGQPSEGQGGFYGAIKTRSERNAVFQPGSRAEPQDLEQLQRLMDHWEAERATLRSESDETAAWAALVADPTTEALLGRLVVKGAPVWGLSVEQREFVARCQRL